MRLFDVNYHEISRDSVDLSRGHLRAITVIRKDTTPIDNHKKFAWADEDYEQAEMYVPDQPTSDNSPLSAMDVVTMLLPKLTNTLSVDDDMALRMTAFYPAWSSGIDYTTGYYVRYNDVLYKCLQKHKSQADWTPSTSVSLWVRVDDPSIEFPKWRQPQGAHDAYAKGSKVSHNGKHWQSDVDANVWEPGQYGWTQNGEG